MRDLRIGIHLADTSPMSLLSTNLRYGAVAQLFHWLTAVLILATWLTSGSRDIMTMHQTLGMAIFSVVVLRLIWRTVDRRPDEVPMPKAMALASRGVHWLLYGMMLALVGTGVAGWWLEGHAVTVYGLGTIGPWLATSRSLGEAVLEVHEAMGTMILLVAGLHAAAAIFHHVFLRDRVLKQMLPAG